MARDFKQNQRPTYEGKQTRYDLARLRVPPQNIDSERALLGAIMLRPDAMIDVLDVISPESFYAEKHRMIFSSMLELYSKSDPIDLLSLSSKLREKGQLDQIGGAAYLTDLVNSVPSASNIKYYADIIYKKFMMRALIEAAEGINDLGYEENEEVEMLLEKAEHQLFELTNNAGGAKKFIELKNVLGDAWERIEKLHQNKNEVRGIKTGFKDLDNMLAGLQKSDLIILAARPSMGKTALALDIARQTSTLHKNPVCIFSLEMSNEQLVDRMIAAESRVNAWSLRTGNISLDEDFNRIRDSLDRLSKAPITIDDQPGNNILKMRSVARRMKREGGLGLIVVDYLQLMTPINTRNSDSAVQQVTELSRSLKHLARDLDVPVLALSQLSRAVEQRGGKPRLSDLRDSGSIEQDADVVMFIHREDKYKEDSDKVNIAEILVEKHRNGPTGKVDLYFDEKKTTFLSIDKNDFGAFSDANNSAAESF
jgi:replicative DNA helicase